MLWCVVLCVCVCFRECVEEQVTDTSCKGKSRSGTLVLAYLIAHKGYSYSQALAFLRTKRRLVRPNAFFTKQLREYSARLGRLADPDDSDDDDADKNE